MQKEDGNKNALRSNARNQGQQIQPSRNIENRGVQDEIYCEDTIENCGHFLSFRTTGLSSALNPSGHSSLITFSTAQSFARAFPGIEHLAPRSLMRRFRFREDRSP